MNPFAKKITIEYEDGSVKQAKGEDAKKIFEHWISLECFWANHGGTYAGPCLKLVKGKTNKRQKKPKLKPTKSVAPMIKYSRMGKIQILDENGKVIGGEG